jgi:hypothetical protein
MDDQHIPTIADLFRQWTDLMRQVEAGPDDATLGDLASRAFEIERRAVALPVATARDVLTLIVMTTDACSETPRSTMDALVARAHAEVAA